MLPTVEKGSRYGHVECVNSAQSYTASLRCDCGRTFRKSSYDFLNGLIKCCGCRRCEPADSCMNCQRPNKEPKAAPTETSKRLIIHEVPYMRPSVAAAVKKGYLQIEGNLAHRVIWESQFPKLLRGWDVHHIDEDRRNNDINNLVALPHAIHYEVHDFQRETGSRLDRSRLMELYWYCRGQHEMLEREQQRLTKHLTDVNKLIHEITGRTA